MTRQPIRRRQPAHSWMAGFTHAPSLETACQALEDRLREGRPPLFPDAIARRPFADLERWSD
jgi:hypothetical protein